MKSKIFLPSLSVIFLLEVNSFARPNQGTCPVGRVSIPGHKCLLALSGDKTLTSTMVVDSRVVVICQGHALIPSVSGNVDDATTHANEYTPSQPDLAVFFNNTADSKIQNCVIGTEGAKFDFGVYVLNSQNNSRNLAANSIPVGIGLTGRSLETSTVERNVITGATAGFSLIQNQGNAASAPSSFGASVALNDFFGNGTNVKTTGIQPPLAAQPYTLATELSAEG